MNRANLDRIRSRLTYANVMVTVLAFVLLAGGTAVAAVVITSNSQVGRDTIAGHKPPSGDHPNIIGGSVASTDLAKTSFRGAGLPLDGSGNCGAGSLVEWAHTLNAPVGFYRDLEGRVYLRGFAERCGNPPSGDVIFTLPAGFRPQDPLELFIVSKADGSPAEVDVSSNGQVTAPGSAPNDVFSLYDVSFRCGPSGQNGCP